ncbi:hypothetical protein HMPREF9141_2236 [Prevotella multiformis DSM 16608]|uniref:Uncharacterized protein n=1 Tax=Prevotella multiformis DSM 16608 TaxID=888743 RepID=F0F9G9_9BACT|nr:hypothetical protein HMPREF9141_2236 [Prevotella multiformis DSM 16608]
MSVSDAGRETGGGERGFRNPPDLTEFAERLRFMKPVEQRRSFFHFGEFYIKTSLYEAGGTKKMFFLSGIDTKIMLIFVAPIQQGGTNNEISYRNTEL